MTAHGDDPRVHRIKVELDEEGMPERVRFVCDAPPEATCHQWPNCECEDWSWSSHFIEEYDPLDPHKKRTPSPGHENVQQETCWIDPWFNDAIGHDPSDWLDAYDGDDPELTVADLHSGAVSVTFEGDYMTWEYAEAGASS